MRQRPSGLHDMDHFTVGGNRVLAKRDQCTTTSLPDPLAVILEVRTQRLIGSLRGASSRTELKRQADGTGDGSRAVVALMSANGRRATGKEQTWTFKAS
jgi:hypothetical protein